MFSEAIKLCPNDESTRRHYAESLWQRGASGDALAQMEQAARLSGGSAESFVRLGEMHLVRGEADRAAQAAQRALAADPRLAAAWALQGDVKRQKGDPAGALASYHRALSYREHDPRVQMSVAAVYRELARPERSLATLQVLAERFPPGEEPSELLHLQGLVERDLGRMDAAAATLAQASARSRPTVELLHDLAETQLLAGRPERAAAAAERALALAPDHAQTRELLARAQTLQQRMAARIER